MATTGQDGGGTVYIRPVVSADGVAAGVADIKQEFASIPVAAQQAAQSTSKSLASLGVPAEATANIERFKDAFGGIARATKEELGESARFTNSYVSQLRRTAADVDSVTQAMVNKARTLQSADPRLQNDTVNQTIAGLQKLATQNEAVTAAVKQQAAAQQVANKAASEAAIQFANFERSAQSARLELLSFGKTASEKYQIRAELLGIDKTQAVQKIVTDLKAAEAAALAAGKGVGAGLQQPMERLGMTAKQTTAALRQVPAQFTDIIVSLQGGQAPLTVLLQQGGQLKDVFGGVGAAAKALGGYVLGLVNPLSLTAAAVGAVGYAAYAASEDVKALRNAVALAGTQSTTSFSALSAAAKGLNDMGVSSGTASEALATFIGAGAKVDGTLQGVTKAAIDLERVGGASIEETAKKLVALAKDPLADFDNLTLATYKQIEALLEQGNKTEAVTVAQRAFIDSIKDQEKAHAANLGPLDTATKAWGRYAASVWDAVKALSNSAIGGITGRAATGDEERSKLQAERDFRFKNGYDTSEQDKRLAYFAAVDAAQKNQIANAAKEIKLKELLANFDKNDESTKRLRDRNKLIADNTELLEAGLISQQKYNDVLAAFDKKHKEKGPKSTGGISDAEKGLRTYNDLIAKSTDLNADFEEKWNGLSAAYRGRKIDLDQLTAAQKELLSEQRFSKEADKAWADQSAASAKAVAELSKKYDAYVKTLDASAIAVGNQLQKLQDEELATAIAAEQNISLAQAIEQVTIARLSEAQTKAYANGDREAGDAIKREIEARKKLATAIGGKEVREANKKAADDAAKEWQKTADKINDSITDALMRGFESGKGFAENLRDAVVNMFKTMVLRPVVQATVGGTLGVLGMNAAAQSADSGGVGGLLNTASDLKTLYGMKDWFTDFGSAAASSVIRGGELAYSAGFEKIGSSMMSVSEAGNFAAVSEGLNTLGSGLSYFSAAVSASQGKWGSAAGTVIGTAFGGPLGGAVGSFLGGLVDNIFGGDGGPKLASTGDAIRRYDKGGALTENATNGAWFFTNTADANKLLDGLESRYQKAAKALGIGTVATQFDYGSNNRGNFALAGAAGNSRANTGEIAYSAEAMQVAASRAVFAALQGSELPKYLSGLLDSVGDINALSQAQIEDVLNTAQAYKGLHDVMVQMPFEALHDLSYSAAKGLIEFSGGLDKLTQNLGTYYDNFYSAEEKKAQTLANITKTLTDAGALTKTTRTAIAGEFDVRVGAQGDASLEQRYATSVENLDMPKTREEFRALVESMRDLGGEAAQKAYAALLSVSGAFASITPAANDAAAALEKDLAARATWQQKLDVLTGKTTERALSLQADLAGTTDAATQALIRQVYAQEDAATQAQATADAMATAADTLRTALQSSLDASRAGVDAAVAAIRTSVGSQKAAMTAAYNDQADAIRTSLDTVGTSINKLRSLSGNLKSTLDNMRIIGGDLGYRQAAQAQITAALATARAGGGLPVNGQLDSALRTVSQSSDELFGSFAEYAFDFYKTANDIAALSDITGTQLTGEELTQSLLKTQADNLKTGFDAELKRLDSLVTAAQTQADAATKATTAIKSLADAITRFTDSLGVTLSNSLATAFEAADLNKSNGVSLAEFQAAFTGLASEATLAALFAQQDADGNGVITQLEAINSNTANLLARMAIEGAGGKAGPAATYTGTQVAQAIKDEYKAGSTTAAIVNAANVNVGVTPADLAKVAAVAGYTEITEYQKRVDGVSQADPASIQGVLDEANRRAKVNGTTAAAEFVKHLLSAGWNAGMGDKYMGWAQGTTNAWATANGFPAFAQGSNYLPNDTMALLHEGEAVIPKAYNPYNPNATGAGNARLESLVQGLTAEVQRLQAIVNDGNRHQQRTADAVNGNPEAPMLVETV
jgi:phage-related minor tail protein